VQPALLEDDGTLLVVFSGFVVNGTVDLDDERSRMTVEVDDEAVDDLLPPKMEPARASSAAATSITWLPPASSRSAADVPIPVLQAVWARPRWALDNLAQMTPFRTNYSQRTTVPPWGLGHSIVRCR
jgi:predicted aminopeptidase